MRTEKKPLADLACGRMQPKWLAMPHNTAIIRSQRPLVLWLLREVDGALRLHTATGNGVGTRLDVGEGEGHVVRKC